MNAIKSIVTKVKSFEKRIKLLHFTLLIGVWEVPKLLRKLRSLLTHEEHTSIYVVSNDEGYRGKDGEKNLV